MFKNKYWFDQSMMGKQKTQENLQSQSPGETIRSLQRVQAENQTLGLNISRDAITSKRQSLN